MGRPLRLALTRQEAKDSKRGDTDGESCFGGIRHVRLIGMVVAGGPVAKKANRFQSARLKKAGSVSRARTTHLNRGYAHIGYWVAIPDQAWRWKTMRGANGS
jgi:hypothetical protein